MNETKEDVSRRELVMKLLGAAAGGVALQAITGCVARTGANEEQFDENSQPVIGTSALKWVDKITDLKGVTGQGVAAAKTSTVVVLGRNARGDGGGGIFEWIKTTATPPSTVEDGGTIFLPTTQPGGGDGPGYWLRLGAGMLVESTWVRTSSGAFDIRWFGAVDGAPDSQSAIQAALDAGYGTLAQREILIPDGTYNALSGLTIKSTATSALTIRGLGRNSKLVCTLAAAGSAIQIHSTVQSTFGSFTMCGVNLSGAFSRGIDLTATGALLGNIRIERNVFSGATINTSEVAPIVFSGLSDVWIVDNEFSGNGAAPGGIENGYEILKRAGVTQARIHVNGNKITGTSTFMAVTLFDVVDSEVRGNTIDQGNGFSPTVASGYGICVYASLALGETRRNMVANNDVRNCAGLGIYLQSSFDSSAIGNVVQDTCKQITDGGLPLAAISANGCDVAITGNVVKTCLKNGIAFTAPYCTVSGNYVEATSAGIKIDGAAHRSSIVGNTMVNVTHGILIDGQSSEGLAITGNTMTNPGGTGGGLSVQPAGVLNDSLVANNAINGFQIGILLNGGNNNVIGANNVNSCSSWGIYVLADNNLIVDNVVRRSTSSGGIVCNGNYCRVSGNVVTGNTGTQISVGGTGVLRDANRLTTGGAVSGTVPLVSGTATVPTTEILSNDTVIVSRTTAAGTPGHLSVPLGTITPGVSFVINSSSLTDTSTVYWEIVH